MLNADASAHIDQGAERHETDTLSQVKRLTDILKRDGVVALPPLVTPPTLQVMQAAFDARMQSVRYNEVDGYIRTERMRRMVEDVLTLAQGFVDIAVHPLVMGVIRSYVGPEAMLCEAKGWETLKTIKDFHGWHGDSWYDPSIVEIIPREIKLAFYLSDVNSGAFQYLTSTHRKQSPRLYLKTQASGLPMDQLAEYKGPAGTCFLFDTSGIHRQGVPVLNPRRAVFYNYHDPHVPLQKEDVDYYRYHPVLLNAAFLGELNVEQTTLLGFGNKLRYQAGFIRPARTPRLQRAIQRLNGFQVGTFHHVNRIISAIRRRLHKS